MKVYTYREAQKKLGEVLKRAREDGEVRIRHSDGSEYALRPQPSRDSPLNVPAVETDVSASEIVEAIRESRARM